MKLLLPGRSLALEDAASVPEAPAVKAGPGGRDAQDHWIRELGRELPGAPEPGGLFERVEQAIMAYRVYPPSLLTAALPNPVVRTGDTLALRMNLPCGFGLGFGTRVRSAGRVVEGDRVRAGFSYITLQGHPELGEAWFQVEKEQRTGLVRIHRHSWSRPGNWLAWLGRPLARRMQIRANRLALDHLERQSLDSAGSRLPFTAPA